jgi:hypothetical protein
MVLACAGAMLNAVVIAAAIDRSFFISLWLVEVQKDR